MIALVLELPIVHCVTDNVPPIDIAEAVPPAKEQFSTELVPPPCVRDIALIAVQLILVKLATITPVLDVVTGAVKLDDTNVNVPAEHVLAVEEPPVFKKEQRLIVKLPALECAK